MRRRVSKENWLWFGFAAFYFLLCLRPVFMFRPVSGFGDDPSYVKVLEFLLGRVSLDQTQGYTYSVGPGLCWMVAALPAKILEILLGIDIPAHFIAAAGSAVLGFLGFRQLVLTLQRLKVKTEDAFLSVSAIFFGCQLLYFMGGRPTLAHAAEFFLITSFIRIWFLNLQNAKWLASLSLVAGLIFVTRVNDFGCFVLLAFAFFKVGFSFKSLLASALPALLPIGFNFFWAKQNAIDGQVRFNQSQVGRLGQVTWENVGFQFSHFFVGNSGGLLLISPVIFLALYFWIKRLRKDGFKPLDWTLLIILAFNFYLILIWQGYGGEYGYRYIYGSLPFLAVILAQTLFQNRSTILRRAVLGLTIWGFYFYWVYNVAPDTMMGIGERFYGSVKVLIFNESLFSNSLSLFFNHPPNIIRTFGLSPLGALIASVSKIPRLEGYSISLLEWISLIVLIPSAYFVYLGLENLGKKWLQGPARPTKI